MNVGDINARVSLNTSGFSQGVKTCIGGLSKIGGSVTGMNQALQLATQGFSLLRGAVRATVGSFMEAQNSADSYRIRLEALLGSAAKGRQVFKDMQKLAAQTPFTLRETMQGAASIAGIMPDPEELKKWMPVIGDLAAATGLAMQEATGQVQRMLSAGASSADLFRERGVLAMLGFTAGVQYSAKETKDILWKAWEANDSKFRGIMEKMLLTVNGQISNMQDRWGMFQVTVMQSGIGDFLISSLMAVNAMLEKTEGGAKDAAKSISDFVIGVIKQIALSMARAIDLLSWQFKFILSGIGTMIDGFKLMPSWMLELGLIGAILLGKKGKAALAVFAFAVGLISKPIEHIANMAAIGEFANKNRGTVDQEEAARLMGPTATLDAQRAYMAKMGIKGPDKSPIEGEGAAEAMVRRIIAEQEVQLGILKEKRAAWENDVKKVTSTGSGDKKGQRELDTFNKKVDDMMNAARGASEAALATDDYTRALIDVDTKMQALADDSKRLLATNSAAKIKFDALTVSLKEFAGVKIINDTNADLDKKIKSTTSEYDALISTMGKTDLEKEFVSIAAKGTDGLDLLIAALEKAGYSVIGLKEKLQGLVGVEQGLAAAGMMDSLVSQMKEQNKQAVNDYRAAKSLYDSTGNMSIADMFMGKGDDVRIRAGVESSMAPALAAMKEMADANPELQAIYEKMKASIPEQIEIAIKFKGLTELEADRKKIEEAIGTIKTNVREVTDAFKGPLSTALEDFATTGKLNFRQLGADLMKTLQMMAAQKTAILLMEAAYQGVMMFADYTNAAVHSTAAIMALTGAGIMGSFVAGSGLANMAHSGMTSIPEDGTWMLQKGERVVDAKTNADLKEYLKQGSGKAPVNMTVNINNSDEQGVMNALPAMKQMIIDAVSGDIASGGSIKKTIQAYAR